MNESHPLKVGAHQHGTQILYPEDPDLQAPKKSDTWERVSAMDAVIEAFFLSPAQYQVQGRLSIGLAQRVHLNDVLDQAVL